MSERSEHFSCAGRAAGNGETRQPWTSCTPSLESSSRGYSHGSMQYFWMTVRDANAEAYIVPAILLVILLVGCVGASMVVGWQRQVAIRKGPRVDSNFSVFSDSMSLWFCVSMSVGREV